MTEFKIQVTLRLKGLVTTYNPGGTSTVAGKKVTLKAIAVNGSIYGEGQICY